MGGAPQAPPVEVDQSPQVTETENAPVEPEVVAAPEPVEEPAAPEPEYVTREELERVQREAREQAARDASEQIRRDIQRKNALAAREKVQEQEARDRALREARILLHEQGFQGADPSQVSPAFESYTKTYRSAWERTVEADATDGFVLAAAKVLGVPAPSDLEPSDRAYAYADGVQSYVKGLYDQAYAKAKADLAKDSVPRSDIPSIIEGARKKWLKEQKPSEDFQGPEGQPAPANGALTPDQYAAMSPVEQRRIQRERPDLINAMTRQISLPQR